MTLHADPIDLLRTRTSEKWTAYPDDVLPLFVAEMDYPLAPPIAAALHAAVDRNDTGYIGAGRGLHHAFADYARSAWGWEVDPAAVRTTSDIGVVLVEALRRLIEPGDRVVITPPVYPPFFSYVPEAGGVVEEVPLLQTDADPGWSLDLAGLERAFAGGARALLLCNPHNPLGLVHPADELAAVAELADRYGVPVVSDEVHAPLVHRDAVFTPFLAVSEAARRVGVAAHSASKAWNLAGLKCAFFVTASPSQRALVDGLPVEVEERTSLFGLIAAEAAYREGAPWLSDALDAIEANRRLLTDLLAEHLPDSRYREPRASYLAWVDLRAYGWGDDPAARILEEARVALGNGPQFGREGAGFARINLACDPKVLRDAVLRVGGMRR
ncbi:aminotransferase class I/II-fold pyridoxal phosphate-dependent enzyme [Leifsonia sp. F6_8S_P_1B]|uniref:cysteine-S-conjugate beta-lyase n=1 Tax=Leifsonia williamsii TaxID=3035919 RepID=A0ABT8KFE6_9MICO|nr:aminotransferase class I/II-fold pyridoxal phosphate-dependent enzyme [Leifsonia williamsii]MDN4616165.1 aminotransferase class I/II-fold pyridoxal phosphate-dependent enzyme [Leifsonia williamsii]